MTVFFILVFVPLLRQLVWIKGETVLRRKRRAMRIFFVMLFLLLALRHITVGRDVENYSLIFNSVSRREWGNLHSLNLEMAYVVLNKTILLFTNEFQWLLVVTAALTVLPIGHQYLKHTNDPALTIVLFIVMSTFVMLFSGIRQAIAIALGMIAFEFTRGKKLSPFILMVILAVLFHSSGFMLIFMYPLYHAKITKNWLYVVVPIMVMLFVFNRQVFGMLTFILKRFASYDVTTTSTGAYTMIILFVLFCVYAFVIPDESKLDADTIGMRNFLLLATMIQMFAPLHTLAMRMNYYYMVFVPLLIPKIIACRSEKWELVAQMSRYVMLVFFLGYFFFAVVSANTVDVFPYHFFWETVG